ncbi:hypothetical protein DU508_06705 [Pedobacter chinensis]|uniref:Uncharacterized protein n=1 Tax=Pedobacter chinensis TaxID=2282421 RepID=A0A369Q0X7_9SPHI|nr:hypothetical protein [Pedobacter chinensis]RDC56887.1 hypothetical protein DU508_06705 [Pedobacter chinensis]
MRYIIAILLIFFIACNSKKDGECDTTKLLQTCLDSLSKIPDLKYMDTANVIILYNELIKSPLKLKWGNKKIIFQKKTEQNTKAYFKGSDYLLKDRAIFINSISCNENNAEVAFDLVNTQLLLEVYLRRNQTNSLFEVKAIGEVFR